MGTDPTIRLRHESEKTCCQNGRSGTLVRQGSAAIVIVDMDYLSLGPGPKCNEMDLFAFINHADPTKGSQNDGVEDAGNQNDDDEVLATVVEKPKGSRKKRKAAGGASGSSLPPKTLRADHGTFGASASTGEKSIAALQGLLERITLLIEVGVTAVATLSFITSSVSLTLEREGGGSTDSFTGPNLRTQHPSERFVVLSDSPCHSSSNITDVEVSSVVRSLVPDPPIMTMTIATTVVANTSFVPVPRAGNEPVHHTLLRIPPL
ncbi:hypothetical protein Tco_1502887 [Tanacetum coccineum]